MIKLEKFLNVMVQMRYHLLKPHQNGLNFVNKCLVVLLFFFGLVQFFVLSPMVSLWLHIMKKHQMIMFVSFINSSSMTFHFSVMVGYCFDCRRYRHGMFFILSRSKKFKNYGLVQEYVRSMFSIGEWISFIVFFRVPQVRVLG